MLVPSTGRVPAANRPPCPPSSRLLPGTSTASARGWRSSRNSSPRNARIYVPAGDQGPRRRLSRGPVRRLGYTSSSAGRCITASPSPAASRSARMRGSTAGQWRGPARRRAPRLRHPARECLCPGRRRQFPTASQDKFGQKLDFIERMTRWSETCTEPTILVGDLNVAPLEVRVEPQATAQRGQPHAGRGRGADPAAAQQQLGRPRPPVRAPSACSPGGAIARPTSPGTTGRRLDHMWATGDVAQLAVGHRVYEPCRNWTRPSDHVPLMTEFAI